MRETWSLDRDLSIYERALETVHHSDTLLWELIAIIWGANTLLLGFILEVTSRGALPIVILVSFVGMLLTGFAALICWVAKKIKEPSFKMCREIEARFPPNRRLHTEIHGDYPRGIGRIGVYAISGVFEVAWICVIIYSLELMYPNKFWFSGEIRHLLGPVMSVCAGSK